MHVRPVLFVSFAVAVAAVWPVPGGQAEEPEGATGDLVVEVNGLNNSRGAVRAGLFESSGKFPLGVDDVSSRMVEADIDEGGATLTFEELPHGTYAVVAYHDANDNGELDKNWVGMPNEGAGVYRPVDSRFPPPTFEDCKFRFDAAEATVDLELRYL